MLILILKVERFIIYDFFLGGGRRIKNRLKKVELGTERILPLIFIGIGSRAPKYKRFGWLNQMLNVRAGKSDVNFEF